MREINDGALLTVCRGVYPKCHRRAYRRERLTRAVIVKMKNLINIAGEAARKFSRGFEMVLRVALASTA